MDTQRGSATPFVALVVLLAGLFALALGKMGGAAAQRADAQTAADAAALAGAADGRHAAQALAAANGARIISYEQKGDDTRVVVELGLAQATGRARREAGGPDTASGGSAQQGLAPAMRAALARAAQLLGQPVPITSGYRSHQDQERLYANRANNPYPVAPPGSSMHEQGLAVDVPREFAPRLLSVAPQAGLCHPFPDADPVHFEVCR